MSAVNGTLLKAVHGTVQITDTNNKKRRVEAYLLPDSTVIRPAQNKQTFRLAGNEHVVCFVTTAATFVKGFSTHA